MKKVSWLVGAAAMVAAAVYTMVSLARWEWSRALFFGLVFVAAELGLVAGAMLSKVAKLERRIDELGTQAAPDATEVIRAAGAQHDRFPWLKVDATDVVTRTNVFVTLVVGGGVILSGGAWLLDKLASRTVDPGREHQLGVELQSIAYPDGLIVDDMVARARSRPDIEDDRLTTFLYPRS